MYSFDSRVRYSECDENGMLALVPMMSYLQDCSIFQCEKMGRGLKELRRDHLGWFVTSWLVQIDSLPHFCDTITTSTWCYAMKRLQAERCFEIRGAGGTTHVRADSQWYMYDFSQGRVISIPRSESVFLQGDERPAGLPQIPRHLKPQGVGTPTSPIVVTEQHLDTNRHVNNAEYVRFALLAAGELGHAVDLARLEVQYRAMALLGDTLSPVVYGGGNDITVSVNGEDGKARAIVRMKGRAWRRSPERRPTVHVAAAIIQRDGRILAARRAHGMDGWEFPGGKVEDGETSEEACRREAMEELGCKIQVMRLLDTLTYDYPEFHLVMDCFVCALAPGATPVARPGEHRELRWLGRGELLDVGWLPADKGLVQALGLAWDQIVESESL